ncbi:MAG TPA: MFS transporter [Chloroflexota bacterium]|nr:MFS transporter [Chloroflexota bacterium]
MESEARRDDVGFSVLRANRRQQVGWCFYDWANAAFPTIVVTVVLGPYLTTIAKAAADADGYVYPLGIPVAAGSLFPYAISLSVLLQALLLPFLGAIGDASGRKKLLLALFTYLGALATVGLYTLQGANYGLGVILLIVGNVCYGAAIIYFNAFLPAVARPDERNAVSSYGWALGYLGGGLLLAFTLVLLTQASRFGLTTGTAVRVSLATAGVWWGGFALITLFSLPRTADKHERARASDGFAAGLRQLADTLRTLRRYPQTLLFLVAYLLYADGIHTVTAVSAQFGQEALGLSISTLTAAILMVQFVAFFGSLAFNVIAQKDGSKLAILVDLVIWAAALVYAYGFLRTARDFFIMAAVIALVLGGGQALSRSAFSQMIPVGREAEYFSIYEISDRGTSWLGPLLYGLAFQFTGSYRIAILSLVILFTLGATLLAGVDMRRAASEAGNPAPSRI